MQLNIVGYITFSYVTTGVITASKKKRSQSGPALVSKQRNKLSANLQACNATAREIFKKKTDNDIVEMQLEIDRLCEQLEQQKSLRYVAISSVF